MAKVKVLVDLTKVRPRHVWIGLEDEYLIIGQWQQLEYEILPPPNNIVNIVDIRVIML